MTRDDLRRASELLKEAAEATTGEARERLYAQSNEFARHATADRGPDHGRLARHEQILQEIQADASDEVSDRIDEALERVEAYRATVEGV